MSFEIERTEVDKNHYYGHKTTRLMSADGELMRELVKAWQCIPKETSVEYLASEIVDPQPWRPQVEQPNLVGSKMRSFVVQTNDQNLGVHLVFWNESGYKLPAYVENVSPEDSQQFFTVIIEEWGQYGQLKLAERIEDEDSSFTIWCKSYGLSSTGKMTVVNHCIKDEAPDCIFHTEGDYIEKHIVRTPSQEDLDLLHCITDEINFGYPKLAWWMPKYKSGAVAVAFSLDRPQIGWDLLDK